MTVGKLLDNTCMSMAIYRWSMPIHMWSSFILWYSSFV